MKDHAKAASSILSGGETVHVSKLKPVLTTIAAEVWPAFISDESKEAASALLLEWAETASAEKLDLLEAILSHKNQDGASSPESDAGSNVIADVQNLLRRLRSSVESTVKDLASEISECRAELAALKAEVQAEKDEAIARAAKIAELAAPVAVAAAETDAAQPEEKEMKKV